VLEDQDHRLLLGYYARGWWPLTVVDALQPRVRAGERQRCAAPDCTKTVPYGRRSYCSEQCVQREKKRRQQTHRSVQAGG
jgi:hypothetical protein